jgi:hypothetical protein
MSLTAEVRMRSEFEISKDQIKISKICVNLKLIFVYVKFQGRNSTFA